MSKKEEQKFDCERPLPNPRHEKFCKLIAEGRRQADAYRDAGFDSSDSSIYAAASRLAARSEVKARIKALQMEAIAGAGPITATEIQKKLETVIRTSSSSSDIIKAISELNDQTGILDELKAKREAGKNRPDPCAVMAYLCTFSGKAGADIIGELGGREFVEGRLSEVLKAEVSITL